MDIRLKYLVHITSELSNSSRGKIVIPKLNYTFALSAE